MFIKTRIMFKLHSWTYSYDELHSNFRIRHDKLYNKLFSLVNDGYVEHYIENDIDCFRVSSVNAFRNYCFMLLRRFVRFWYDFVMVVGSIAAIATLIVTLRGL